MTTKIQIASIIALMAVIMVSVPAVMAEMDQRNNSQKVILEVGDFVGSIPLLEDATRAETHSLVTVGITTAVALYPDVQSAKLGHVINEDGDKYLVWILFEKEFDVEGQIATKTTYIIDAADSSNTTTFTKEFDASQTDQRNSSNLDERIERLIHSSSTQSGNSDRDALKIEFLQILEELRDAIADGDTDTANGLREQLHILREQLKDIRGA